MTSKRIKEIQEKTAYPESVSVQQALLKVWNECEQEFKPTNAKLVEENERLKEANNNKATYVEEMESELSALKVENERVNSLLDDYERSGCELENYNNKIIKQLQSELSAAKERVLELELFIKKVYYSPHLPTNLNVIVLKLLTPKQHG